MKPTTLSKLNPNPPAGRTNLAFKRRHIGRESLLAAAALTLSATVTLAQCYEPTDDVPPPDSAYSAVAAYHAEWANGWSIVGSTYGDDPEHQGFTVSTSPPPSGQTQTHTFNSSISASLSMDGGATFTCATVPAMVTVRLSHTNDAGCTANYSTEMLQLDVTNGLPAGAMIRQSPTQRSLGQLTIQPVAGGGFMMSSFFDIWADLSLDGGHTWLPATNAARMMLTNKSPELFSVTNRLPMLQARYISKSNSRTIYCTNGACCTNGIIISNIVHSAFTANQPPPPLDTTNLETFGSQVDFQLSLNGGATFSQQHAPANVGVMVSHTKDVEGTQFFDTQMIQLDIQGGTLPSQIRVRQSPSEPSLGKAHIRSVSGGSMISSSFDIHTELSMDGGVTWTPSCCPEKMALAAPVANDSATVRSFNPAGYWQLNETVQPPPTLQAVNQGALGPSGFGFYFGGTPGVPGALAGSPDTAARFNGTVVVPYSSALSLNAPFSVEAWLKAASTTTGTPCPLSCGTFGANRSGWLIYQNGNSGWNFRMYNGSGANTTVNLNAGGATAPGAWYHVAAVYDGLTAALYVNGVPAQAPAPPPFAPNVNGPLTIAMRSDSTFFWPGTADEVAIYTNALAPSTVQLHYFDGTNTSPPIPYDQLVLSQNPIIYLRLDEPALPTAINIGTLSIGENGTYEPGSLPGLPGVPFTGFGPGNYACEFNGTTGYIDIPGANLDFTGPVTLSAWALAAPANGIFQTIVGKGDTSYRLDMDFSGYPHFADGQANPDVVGPNRMDDGQWHMLTGVYDGLAANSLYVDGLLAGTAPATNGVAGNVNDVWIGGAPDYLNNRLFQGLVDEVAIVTNALAAGQILQLYNGSLFVTNPGPSLNITIQIVNTNQVQLIWCTGTLQSATDVTGPYADMNSAVSPYTFTPSAAKTFYRVRE